MTVRLGLDEAQREPATRKPGPFRRPPAGAKLDGQGLERPASGKSDGDQPCHGETGQTSSCVSTLYKLKGHISRKAKTAEPNSRRKRVQTDL